MTPFEKCCMIAYRCNEVGEVQMDDDEPVVLDVDLRDPYGFISSELGFVDFNAPDGFIMCPEDWPSPPYPECICGDSCFGAHHYVLQWGDADDDVDADDWAEWQIAVHPECLATFFEYILGAEEMGYWDRDEWTSSRDEPPDHLWDDAFLHQMGGY